MGGCAIKSYRRQHVPIGSGLTEAAFQMVCTPRRKRSGRVWTREGGQGIVDLRVIWLSGVWDAVSQHYLASKLIPSPKGIWPKALSMSKRQRRSWEWSDHTRPIRAGANGPTGLRHASPRCTGVWPCSRVVLGPSPDAALSSSAYGKAPAARLVITAHTASSPAEGPPVHPYLDRNDRTSPRPMRDNGAYGGR